MASQYESQKATHREGSAFYPLWLAVVVLVFLGEARFGRRRTSDEEETTQKPGQSQGAYLAATMKKGYANELRVRTKAVWLGTITGGVLPCASV